MTNHSFEFHFIFFLRAEDFLCQDDLETQRTTFSTAGTSGKSLGREDLSSSSGVTWKLGFLVTNFHPSFCDEFSFWKNMGQLKNGLRRFSSGSERNPVDQLIWSYCLIVLPILRFYRCITHPAPAVSSFGQERLQKPVGDSPSASSTPFYHQDGTDRRGLKLFQLLLSSQDFMCKHYIIWTPSSSITFLQQNHVEETNNIQKSSEVEFTLPWCLARLHTSSWGNFFPNLPAFRSSKVPAVAEDHLFPVPKQKTQASWNHLSLWNALGRSTRTDGSGNVNGIASFWRKRDVKMGESVGVCKFKMFFVVK